MMAVLIACTQPMTKEITQLRHTNGKKGQKNII